MEKYPQQSYTKVKLAALSPDALTTGCEVHQKISNCQGLLKKKYFSLQWTGKQCQKGWKPFPRKKSHWNAKHTSKTRKQHHKHGPKKRKINRFYPNFTQLYASTHEHILYHRLWYFIQIPYLSKCRATLFGISRFCMKCKACSLRADSLWGRQISADNPTLIFNFENFAHQPTNTYFISPSLVFHTDCIWIWCWQKYFICCWHCKVFLHNQRTQSYENSQGKYIT